MDSLGDLLKIEIPIVPEDETREGNQELRQRRMHVHKELGFDVF